MFWTIQEAARRAGKDFSDDVNPDAELGAGLNTSSSSVGNGDDDCAASKPNSEGSHAKQSVNTSISLVDVSSIVSSVFHCL